ncbi:TPA: AIPR family protein [Photobacterium damselae]
MAAIQPAMLQVLKKILDERFVPHLPELIKQVPEEQARNKQTSRALSAYALQLLFGCDAVTASRSVVDDFEDNGIDAIYYHEANKTLYFVQSKLKANEDFKLAEAQAFLSGVNLLICKQFDQFNKNVIRMKGAITEALDECDEIKLILAYTGNGVSQAAKNEIRRVIQQSHEDGEEQLQLDYVDVSPQEIEKHLLEEQAMSPVKARIKIHKYRKSSIPRESVFGLVKVSDLVELHDKHPKELYEKNIRYFIGAGKRGVNAAIQNTLREEPQNFYYLNNGITMVASSIKQRGTSTSSRTTRDFEATDVSVVNGAQTISSAAKFAKENPDVDFSEAKVMLTLIQTGEGDFHKQVTKARNLQNPVDFANFASLDDTQERLRREMALYGVDYQYRPQHSSAKSTEIIKLNDLAKALACLHPDIRYPALLKTSSAQFVNSGSKEYKSLFVEDLAGVKAINASIVYQLIQVLIIQAEKTTPSPEKLVCRHSNFAIASVLMKLLRDRINGVEMLDPNELSTIVSPVFDEVRQLFCDSYESVAMGSAHHAFFKRVSDTAKLVNKVWISYQNLHDDAGVIALQQTLAVNDPYNQKLLNMLVQRAPSI